jgi:hypothetical protein
LKAELEVSHLHEKVDHLHAVLLNRLHQMEGRLAGSAASPGSTAAPR